VFASESPVAPRSADEADAYLVTLVSDVETDTSECQVFDAKDITKGPIARVRLPERVSSGTHATWAPRAALT
jgi:carotenoid cleavage dioxygenase-like enzyme